MSRNPELEELFEKLVVDHGGPIVSAHVVTEASGFTFDAGEVFNGHMEEVYCLGLVSEGMLALNMLGDGDDEPYLVKDRDGRYLSLVYLAPDAARRLVADLQKAIDSQ